LQSTFTGSGLQHTSKKKIDKVLVPLISYEEQERIVARIEELFSQLDSSVETLKKTKQQLAVYRQAVLKEAFDTAAQDGDAQTDMLSIEELLSSDRKGMTTGPFGTMINKHEHQKSGIPMLGIENIGEGKFVDGNKIFVTPKKAEELKAFVLHEGDIIISRSGTVGEICAVPQRAEGALLSTNLMRVSLNHEVIHTDYFIFLFQSKGIVLDQVKELCKGSTRVFLNQTILKQIQFPVPRLEQQMEIVSLIESRLSVCDSIEKTVDTALAQADAIRQSILKQAFEGGLTE
jgi:type I restriction enzyme S subunit